MIRAFIAVELPEPLRQEIALFQSELRSSGGDSEITSGAASSSRSHDAKWVETGNLHMTLKFLGNIEESQVSSLKEALTTAAKNLSPFTIHLEGIGAFPRTTDPRVIWLGVSEGKERLIALAQTVELTCSNLGFVPEDRPFSAHLTIGRIRSRDRLAPLIKKLQAADFRGSVPAPVDKIILFQSTLSPHGPTYIPLAEIFIRKIAA